MPVVSHFFKSGDGSWIIIGAQTKPFSPPRIEWVGDIIQGADLEGIPVFLKDNLKPILPPEAFTFDRSHRQEMPEVKGHGD